MTEKTDKVNERQNVFLKPARLCDQSSMVFVIGERGIGRKIAKKYNKKVKE